MEQKSDSFLELNVKNQLLLSWIIHEAKRSRAIKLWVCALCTGRSNNITMKLYHDNGLSFHQWHDFRKQIFSPTGNQQILSLTVWPLCPQEFQIRHTAFKSCSLPSLESLIGKEATALPIGITVIVERCLHEHSSKHGLCTMWNMNKTNVPSSQSRLRIFSNKESFLAFYLCSWALLGKFRHLEQHFMKQHFSFPGETWQYFKEAN